MPEPEILCNKIFFSPERKKKQKQKRFQCNATSEIIRQPNLHFSHARCWVIPAGRLSAFHWTCCAINWISIIFCSFLNTIFDHCPNCLSFVQFLCHLHCWHLVLLHCTSSGVKIMQRRWWKLCKLDISDKNTVYCPSLISIGLLLILFLHVCHPMHRWARFRPMKKQQSCPGTSRSHKITPQFFGPKRERWRRGWQNNKNLFSIFRFYFIIPPP